MSYCRQVSREDGEKKARELDTLFIETSAKTGYNVKQVALLVVTMDTHYKGLFTAFSTNSCYSTGYGDHARKTNRIY